MSISRIRADLRPSDHEYALLSQHVYSAGKARPIANTNFITLYRGWQVVLAREHPSGYFGAVYRCDTSKQFVIAHKGTTGILDLYEDYHGVLLNKYSAQKEDAFLLVDLIVHQIRVHKPDYTISFTGHSLGAFLAELSVYYAVNSLDFPNVNAVTFESPGSRQSMKSLQVQHDVIHLGQKAPIPVDQFWKLDIVTYLCYPNAVNSCNEHVGSIYAINVDLKGGSLASLPITRLLSSHKINGIVQWFHEADVNNNPNYTRHYMAGWPNGYKQLRVYFKHAMFRNRMFSLDPELIRPDIPPPPMSSKEFDQCGKEETSSIISSNTSIGPHDHSQCLKFDKWLKDQTKKINLQYYGNFKVLKTQTSLLILPLHHFTQPFQQFLQYFFDRLTFFCGTSARTTQKVKAMLEDTWKAFDMPQDVCQSLLSYKIQMNSLAIEEVVCGNATQSAHDFRQTISCWLEKTGFTVDDLINEKILQESTAKTIKRNYELPPPIPTYTDLQNRKQLMFLKVPAVRHTHF